MTDPYQVLGVSPTASDDEVKKAYRTLCKRYHPDANVGKPDAAQAEKEFLYSTLKNSNPLFFHLFFVNWIHSLGFCFCIVIFCLNHFAAS